VQHYAVWLCRHWSGADGAAVHGHWPADQVSEPGANSLSRAAGRQRWTHFYHYKFRTLQIGAEEKIGTRLLTDADADYTGIGKFLKRTQLDALPELVNVLKGDMNLLGLRPIRPIFLEKLWDPIRRYPIRSAVKSGMVGIV
jgi:lipopolysaccharide/colanic/teichoic acid biosynthesis glycosyltransferase